MGKTSKGKAKAAAKVAKADRKIARKCKGKCAVMVAALGLAVLFAGCMGTQTPSRSQSLTIKDCTIQVFGCGTETNDVPRIELATQAMSIENSGTETQTASPTQTTDVKPDLDLHYNDAVGKGSQVATSFLDTLTAESAALLKSYIEGKKSGTVTVTKQDGTTQTVECKDGECAECQDCVVK